MSRSRAQLLLALEQRDRIILTTHMTPDGDGLGSEVALCRVLRRRGQDCRILNCSGTPADLRFLLRQGEVITFNREKHSDLVAEADLIIAFDLGAAGRLGRMEAPIRQSSALKAVVDHHQYDNDLFDVAVLDQKASSSAEMTWGLLEAMEEKIDREIAEPLYVGIIQDTGSFNYNATTPRTHELGGKCLALGVNPQRIWRRLNCQKPLDRVRFMGFNISRIALSENGLMSSVQIDLETVRRHGVEARDAFEVVNHLLTIGGVQVGVLALEIGSNRVKFSLRSAGQVDVCAIAKEHTGGGHRYAAGFTVEGQSLEDAYQMILARVQRALEETS